MRTRKPSVEDATFGNNAALGCHMANYSYFNRTVAKWNAEVGHILRTPEMRDRLTAMGAEAAPDTPAEVVRKAMTNATVGGRNGEHSTPETGKRIAAPLESRLRKRRG